MQFVQIDADIFAIGTGLNYLILSHRAQPATEEERQQWQAVWASVNRESYE